jgi:hypothetical protein
MRFLSDIVRYSYSPEELRRCVRAEDFWEFEITKTNFEEKIEGYSNDFLSSHCQLKSINSVSLGRNVIFCPDNMQDALCLRRTDEIVRKAMRSPILNRDDEVRQLLQVLSGETKCSVFRTDITSYFESIPFAEIISNMESDGFRNNSAITYLKNLNAFLLQGHTYSGLPRGLALSSTIADYALQRFDRDVFNSDSVVYYTRYVDDICIVHFGNPQAIQTFVENTLPFKLRLNGRKTQHLTLPSRDSLEFLGYRISLAQPQEVSIAAGKIGKAKKRIVLSLKAYIADKDFTLLLHRLRFLSCSTRMSKVGRKTPVCTGYRHVYRLCHPGVIAKQLKDLDTFLHGIVNSKRYSLGRLLRGQLTSEQRQLLRTVSFEKNYLSKLAFTMTPKRISTIKQAWKYE